MKIVYTERSNGLYRVIAAHGEKNGLAHHHSIPLKEGSENIDKLCKRAKKLLAEWFDRI